MTYCLKIALLLPLSALAATPSAPTATVIPSELKKIEAKYAASKTLEAKFSQTQEIKLTGAKKESSGVVTLQIPSHFRWETLSPDKNLLVSDGVKFWFYTPPFADGERGQVIEKKTSDIQSELASILLSGNFSRIKNVKIKKKAKNIFTLIPGAGVAGSVKLAEIEISKKNAVIERVLLEHEGGNRAEVRLKDVKLGVAVEPGLFKFVTPPGTDQIKE
jgi:outer membrane lipoprotein carrier protein